MPKGTISVMPGVSTEQCQTCKQSVFKLAGKRLPSPCRCAKNQTEGLRKIVCEICQRELYLDNTKKVVVSFCQCARDPATGTWADANLYVKDLMSELLRCSHDTQAVLGVIIQSFSDVSNDHEAMLQALNEQRKDANEAKAALINQILAAKLSEDREGLEKMNSSELIQFFCQKLQEQASLAVDALVKQQMEEATKSIESSLEDNFKERVADLTTILVKAGDIDSLETGKALEFDDIMALAVIAIARPLPQPAPKEVPIEPDLKAPPYLHVELRNDDPSALTGTAALAPPTVAIPGLATPSTTTIIDPAAQERYRIAYAKACAECEAEARKAKEEKEEALEDITTPGGAELLRDLGYTDRDVPFIKIMADKPAPAAPSSVQSVESVSKAEQPLKEHTWKKLGDHKDRNGPYAAMECMDCHQKAKRRKDDGSDLPRTPCGGKKA